MADTSINLFHDEIDVLSKAIDEYSGYSGRVIDEVLHGEGEKEIEDKIQMLLPYSGRRWKGKAPAAKTSKPFRHDNGPLSVTVRTKPRYHYLYFPDDGSSTMDHVGNQQFMKRGAEAATPRIVELCLGKLTEEFK